jgi:hypothetical protein
MADSKPIIGMSVNEIGSLADRLGDRADAIENLATRDLANDLRLAAKVIKALTRSFNPADKVSLDNGGA